ncbi:hypothetical protein H257_19433 [Aphanomyces astaci]|uniref:Uncharacterized protein n=1 Tax=Aphanomyces astaci TaxID=112090 RepID=W4FA02_APHAT|nr:hypothetical protein H257_19433 [Aphanomyces astaci]ETV63636.1 hypothetical protein H257_19433 [Aphanomyces astaci]|eukprot:XP_009846879.1 hypothetical protein H257_19433 [Aphanomyces astaci]
MGRLRSPRHRRGAPLSVPASSRRRRRAVPNPTQFCCMHVCENGRTRRREPHEVQYIWNCMPFKWVVTDTAADLSFYLALPGLEGILVLTHNECFFLARMSATLLDIYDAKDDSSILAG